MKTRITGQLAAVAILAAVLLLLSKTWALPSSAFDQLDLLVDIRGELVRNYVEDPDQQKLIEAAIRGMIDALNDPHTAYLTREDLENFDRQVTGTFSGIGAEVDLHEDRLRIVTPLEGSPAWEAGIMAGDIVLQIGDESTLGMTLTEAVGKLTGEAGTAVTLRVRHESGEEQDITITRAVINIQTVRGFRRDAEQHYELLIDPDHRIGYLRLTQFNERTANELKAALDQLNEQDMRGLILDMRFNPGGLLPSAIQVSDMFLEAGQTIASVEGRTVSREVFRSTDETRVAADVPIVVLANDRSASAAEIVTGALKDNERALFVGSRTFGKGSVQQIRMLEGGRGALKMTNAYYYIPSGRVIHRREDSQTWGVDPSEGSYVAMTGEAEREMIRIRRESDRIVPENGENHREPVTPAFIEDDLKDPQLAASLRAVLGKLETGEWPQVGEADVERQVAATHRQNLEQRRQMLLDQVSELESELEQIEAGESEPGEDAGAEADERVDEQADAEREPAEALEPVTP
ncbi:MAG: S41 family peptidase [Phycisphaeraceae bacterium]